MQKAGNHPLFVEPGLLRKIQQIDAVELVVLAVLDQLANSVGHRRVGGLFQHGKLRLGFTHGSSLKQIAKRSKHAFVTEA